MNKAEQNDKASMYFFKILILINNRVYQTCISH